MSVTFYPKGIDNLYYKVYTSCQCVDYNVAKNKQSRSFPGEFKNPEDLAGVEEYADHDCPDCGGSGMCSYRSMDPQFEVNYSNSNALILLKMMEMANDESDLYGEVSIPDFRKALIKALAKNSSDYERKDETRTTHYNHEGLDRIRTNFFSKGLSRDDITERLKRLMDMAVAAQKAGATGIIWS